MSQTQSKSGINRFLPIGLVLVLLVLFFALGGPDYVNIDTLRDNRDGLLGFVSEHLILSVVAVILIYAALVGISFPGAWILTVISGFLFGTFLGAAAAITGATLGATAIFLVARYAIGDSLSRKAGPYMQKFEAGLKENELSYLFILRLVPIFPFFIVNIVPALFQVKVRNYVLSTLFGIMPGALVYAGLGNSINTVFEAGEDVKFSGLMTRPSVLVPIIGLICLALIPVIYKQIRASRAPA